MITDDPATLGFSPDRLARIDAALDQDIARGWLPGAVVLVARAGRLAHVSVRGLRDPASGAAMTEDSIFRIYSMTKPLTSVAALILMEQGRLSLTDSLASHIPQFARMTVSVTDRGVPRLVPARQAITIHDLLTHCAGFTYGERSPNALIRQAQQSRGLTANPRDMAPEAFLAAIAASPLRHQPGGTWEYGPSTDVLGLVIERITGQRLGAFLAEQVCAKLGMTDFAFHVPHGSVHRLAHSFARDPISGAAFQAPNQIFAADTPARMDAGGAGAVATAWDYLCFAQMLLDGGRNVLSPNSVRLMMSDHLAGRVANPEAPGLAAFQSPGYGFGLGLGVRLAEGGAAVPGSRGDAFWSGSGGTTFLVDPAERLAVVFMAQMPGPLRLRYRTLIRQLVYQAITDAPPPQDPTA